MRKHSVSHIISHYLLLKNEAHPSIHKITFPSFFFYFLNFYLVKHFQIRISQFEEVSSTRAFSNKTSRCRQTKPKVKRGNYDFIASETAISNNNKTTTNQQHVDCGYFFMEFASLGELNAASSLLSQVYKIQ